MSAAQPPPPESNAPQPDPAGEPGWAVHLEGFDEDERGLARLIERAAAGRRVVLFRGGEPVAQLGPAALKPGERERLTRPFGLAAGEFTVPDDFDAPLPDEVQALFGASIEGEA